MVFRDYLVRCKRCKIPYNPKNVSRIKTCIFCRRSLIEDKNERIELLQNDVQKYYETQGNIPTAEIIKTWIKLKFEVSDKKVNEIYSMLEKSSFKISKEKSVKLSAVNA